MIKIILCLFDEEKRNGFFFKQLENQDYFFSVVGQYSTGVIGGMVNKKKICMNVRTM